MEAAWTLTRSGDEGPGDQRVVPDGCIDILFDFRRATVRLIGPMTTPVRHRLEGRVDVLGIRFRPGAAAPLFEGEAAALRDASPSAEAVVPRWRELETLAARLAPLASRLRRRGALDAAAAWLARAPEADEVALAAGRFARARRGRASVAETADAIGVTPRTLERRFRAAVGLSPKLALRIERFREAQRLLDADPGASLSRVAFRAGYADQSHMTREVTRLAGVPPARWAAERRGVASVQDGEPARV